jgi:hypothetical protein
VDDETMRRMDSYRDVDWSEVIRRAIRARVEVEERMRRRIDRVKALKASEDMERLRAKTPGRWSGVEEVRKWRKTRPSL